MSTTSAKSSHDGHATDLEKSQAQAQAAPQQQQQQSQAPKYSLGFFDADLAPIRKIYLGILGKVTMAVIILIWAIVTIYWGSLWKQTEHSGNINAWVIDRDNSTIGQAVTSALIASNAHPVPHLTWHSVAPSAYPTADDVDHAVAVDQKTWITVDIAEGATARLIAARAAGDATYDPTSAITLIYSEARSQTTVDGVVLSVTRGVLGSVLPSLAGTMAAQYLSSISGNATAISALASAPQTIASPVSYSSRNLRPWDLTVAVAPTFVGLIYLLILAFNVTMGHMAARAILSPKLRLKSYILVRIFVPMVPYFFISLMFSLINIAFNVHFERFNGSYGAGFMLFWMASLLGMMVLGLTTEFAITLVGPPFIGFFLVVYIILNVSVANVPFALQDRIFYYGYAMPFNAVKFIYLAAIFNTGNREIIGRSFGILLAWLFVLFGLIALITWRERRSEQKQAAKAVEGRSE